MGDLQVGHCPSRTDGALEFSLGSTTDCALRYAYIVTDTPWQNDSIQFKTERKAGIFSNIPMAIFYPNIFAQLRPTDAGAILASTSFVSSNNCPEFYVP